jgi:hypothetical protein
MVRNVCYRCFYHLQTENISPHLILLMPILLLQEEPELLQCTQEHHDRYTSSYGYEYNAKFCKDSWLDGQQCAACEKRFVPGKAGLGEFRPDNKAPVYFCQDCKNREVQRRSGSRGKVPGVVHSFCNSCYQSKLSLCSTDTPRWKQSTAVHPNAVLSSSLDSVSRRDLC